MPKPQNPVLKGNYLKAREKYLKAMREAIAERGRERTLNDTKKTLEALKLEHKFLASERKRLEHTITRLAIKGKAIDPRFVKRLQKVMKEDEESRSRYRSIKHHYDREMKGAK